MINKQDYTVTYVMIGILAGALFNRYCSKNVGSWMSRVYQYASNKFFSRVDNRIELLTQNMTRLTRDIETMKTSMEEIKSDTKYSISKLGQDGGAETSLSWSYYTQPVLFHSSKDITNTLDLQKVGPIDNVLGGSLIFDHNTRSDVYYATKEERNKNFGKSLEHCEEERKKHLDQHLVKASDKPSGKPLDYCISRTESPPTVEFPVSFNLPKIPLNPDNLDEYIEKRSDNPDKLDYLLSPNSLKELLEKNHSKDIPVNELTQVLHLEKPLGTFDSNSINKPLNSIESLIYNNPNINSKL